MSHETTQHFTSTFENMNLEGLRCVGFRIIFCKISRGLISVSQAAASVFSLCPFHKSLLLLPQACTVWKSAFQGPSLSFFFFFFFISVCMCFGHTVQDQPHTLQVRTLSPVDVQGLPQLSCHAEGQRASSAKVMSVCVCTCLSCTHMHFT